MTEFLFKPDPYRSVPPAEHDASWTLIEGETKQVLECLYNPGSGLADRGEVRLWITSPPYYRQVDYGVEGQLGLEDRAEKYLAAISTIAGLMRRTSTLDANVFWVLRDTFNWAGSTGGDYRNEDGTYSRRIVTGARDTERPRKCMLNIPARTAEMFIRAGWRLRSKIIWDKQDARRGSGDSLSYSYEEILHFQASDSAYFNHNAVRRPGDYRLLSVWRIPPAPNPVVDLPDGRTVVGQASFPLLIPEICLQLASEPGDLVCDPFGGMGTTAVAALKWGRNVVHIDIHPDQIDATEYRLRQTRYTDGRVIRGATTKETEDAP